MTEIEKATLEVLAAEVTDKGPERTEKRKIACNSKTTAALLYYLKLTVPMFSGSAVSREVLEEGLEKRFPELWAEIEQLVPESSRESFEWDWQVPKLKKGIMEKVRKYMAGPRSRAIVSVYSPKATVALEYLRRTEPETSMSRICMEIIEAGFKEKLPGLWKEMETA